MSRILRHLEPTALITADHVRYDWPAVHSAIRGQVTRYRSDHGMRLEDDDIDEHAATVVCLLLRQLATGTDLQLQHLDSRLFRLVASVAQGRTIDKSEIRYDEHGVANRLPVTVYFGDRAAIVAACGNPCGVGQYTLESSRGVRVGFSRRGAIPLADGDSDPQLSSDMADEWDDWIAGLDPVDRARALADCGNYRGSLLRV